MMPLKVATRHSLSWPIVESATARRTLRRLFAFLATLAMWVEKEDGSNVTPRSFGLLH